MNAQAQSHVVDVGSPDAKPSRQAFLIPWQLHENVLGGCCVALWGGDAGGTGGSAGARSPGDARTAALWCGAAVRPCHMLLLLIKTRPRAPWGGEGGGAATNNMGNDRASEAGREGSRSRHLCDFLQPRGPKPSPRHGTSVDWALLAIKNHKSRPPGPLPAGPGSPIIPQFRGSTIEGLGVTKGGPAEVFICFMLVQSG